MSALEIILLGEGSSILRMNITTTYNKQIRNLIVAVNRSAYNEYCQKIQYYITKTDPNVKKFWQCSRVLMGNKVCTSIPPILQNGKSVTDSSTKCELFNAYFCEQQCLPSDATEDSLPDFQLITHHKLTALHITPEQALHVLLSLDVNKSVGPDNISHSMETCKYHTRF